MKGKVFEFKSDINTLKNIALSYKDKGENLRALKLFREIAKTQNDLESYKDLVGILVKMGQMDEAIKIMYKIALFKWDVRPLGEVIFEYLKKEMSSPEYPLMSTLLEMDEEEYLELHREMLIENVRRANIKLVYPEKERDYTAELTQAKDLMERQEHEEALAILRKIPKSNIYFIEAGNLITECLLSLDDFFKASENAVYMFKKFPNDVNTICYYFEVEGYFESDKKLERTIKKLVNASEQTEELEEKILRIICDKSTHLNVLKRVEVALKVNPYNDYFNYIKLIALLKLGDKDKARETLIDLSALSESVLTKYYAQNFDRIDAETLSYQYKLNKEQIEEFDKIYEEEVGQHIIITEDFEEIETEEGERLKKQFNSVQDFEKYFDYCFEDAYLELSDSVVLTMITLNVEVCFEYLLTKLADVRVSDEIKEMIFRVIVCESYYDGQVVYNVDHKPVSFFLERDAFIDSESEMNAPLLGEAYSELVRLALFKNIPYILDDLLKGVKKVKGYLSSGLFDESNLEYLCACILYYSNKKVLKHPKEFTLSVIKLKSEKKFERYIKLLNLDKEEKDEDN